MCAHLKTQARILYHDEQVQMLTFGSDVPTVHVASVSMELSQTEQRRHLSWKIRLLLPSTNADWPATTPSLQAMQLAQARW